MLIKYFVTLLSLLASTIFAVPMPASENHGNHDLSTNTADPDMSYTLHISFEKRDMEALEERAASAITIPHAPERLGRRSELASETDADKAYTLHISFNKRDEIVETQLLKRGEALKPTKDPQNDADMAYTLHISFNKVKRSEIGKRAQTSTMTDADKAYTLHISFDKRSETSGYTISTGNHDTATKIVTKTITLPENTPSNVKEMLEKLAQSGQIERWVS